MISLICTVLNERPTLPEWLKSLTSQTVEPDEIVIVDGGSTDGTWEWLLAQASHHDRLRVFQDHGNIAHGRNRAISEARGESIVVTDAGCTYDSSWCAKLSAPLKAGTALAAATGFGPGLTGADSALTVALASVTTPAPSEFMRDWLPSSRSVAFMKQLWHDVGGYPEWLPYSEDVVFDLKLQQKAPFTYIREPLVFWRPRATVQGFMRQLFHYTYSEGLAGLNTHRQFIRYISYAAGIALFVWGWHYVLLLAAALYFFKYWRRASAFSESFDLIKKFQTFILTACLVCVGDLAKMAGWPVGIAKRLFGSRQLH